MTKVLRRSTWLVLTLLAVVLGGCGGQKELSECKDIVLDFENELLVQDDLFHTKYQPFLEACQDMTAVQAIIAAAEDAAQVGRGCNSQVTRIEIPTNIPPQLNELLEHARKHAAASYFARGKNAENIVFGLTGQGKQYASTEQLIRESEQFILQTGLALASAKQMVGIPN